VRGAGAFGEPPARGALGVSTTPDWHSSLAFSGDLAAGVTPCWQSADCVLGELRSRHPSGPQPQYNILHYIALQFALVMMVESRKVHLEYRRVAGLLSGNCGGQQYGD
jgi:hypothetical protein